MTHPEGAGELDPILEDPDSYFLEKYGDQVIQYKEHSLPLRTAIEFERMARTPEEIDNDPKTRRANIFIGMLREAGVLEEIDDRTYSEEEQ